VLVAFYNFVPRHLSPVLFGNSLVIDRAKVFHSQQPEFELFPLRCRIQRDRNINQSETDTTLPNCSHIWNLFRFSRVTCVFSDLLPTAGSFFSGFLSISLGVPGSINSRSPDRSPLPATHLSRSCPHGSIHRMASLLTHLPGGRFPNVC